MTNVLRFCEMKQKEVINIKDGARFGFVSDMEIDCEDGKIISIIIPGEGKIFGMFGNDQEYRVPWDKITQIGEDLILIDCDTDKVLVDCD